MATVNVVTPDNLGTEFDVNAPAINLRLGSGLVKNANGEIEVSAITSMIARLEIDPVAITNTAAPWNDLALSAGLIDTIGGTFAGGDYTPPAGTYYVSSVVNMFDNNSARVAHRERYLVGGAPWSVMEGHNYMRDATAHDSAANIYPDLIAFDGSQALSLEAQTNSSLTNTTTVTGGWLILLKVA